MSNKCDLKSVLTESNVLSLYLLGIKPQQIVDNSKQMIDLIDQCFNYQSHSITKQMSRDNGQHTKAYWDGVMAEMSNAYTELIRAVNRHFSCSNLIKDNKNRFKEENQPIDKCRLEEYSSSEDE